MTARCRDCDAIPKVEGAGSIIIAEDGTPVQIMHNGLRVVAGGYYGEWMIDLIGRCKGHHEPQEERIFFEVLRHIPASATMLEIGGAWAYYSLWFLTGQAQRSAIVIEPDPAYLEIGRRNAALNGLTPEFHQGFVGGSGPAHASFTTEQSGTIVLERIHIPSFLESRRVTRLDLMHCDAQGVELDVIAMCADIITDGRIGFLVISTHAEAISGHPLTHQRCLALIQQLGGTILAEHDVHESFSGDGLIVAHFGPLSSWQQPTVSYNRYSTSLFRNPIYDLALARRSARANENRQIL